MQPSKRNHENIRKKIMKALFYTFISECGGFYNYKKEDAKEMIDQFFLITYF